MISIDRQGADALLDALHARGFNRASKIGRVLSGEPRVIVRAADG